MNTLRDCREQMVRESSAPYLFAQPPLLPFRSAQVDCPDCHAPLQVQKTRTKTVQTLHLGCFTAQETLLECGHCPNDTIYAAEALSRECEKMNTARLDTLYALYRQRIAYFRANPPPPDWDGAAEALSK